MIYLIEFALLHILFYLVYRIMLSKETQLRFLRGFLLGSTFLSLIVPAVSIPNTTTIPTINMEAIVLPAFSIAQQTEATTTHTWWQVALVIGGLLILIKLVVTLIQLRSFYVQSSESEIASIPVREVKGLENSFTFFSWIFIDPNYFENPQDIARHEYGHAKMLHSLDLIFFYLLAIVFWWVPTIWLMLKELKLQSLLLNSRM